MDVFGIEEGTFLPLLDCAGNSTWSWATIGKVDITHTYLCISPKAILITEDPRICRLIS